jgi:hypothetical protein
MSYAMWVSKVDEGLLSAFNNGVFDLHDFDSASRFSYFLEKVSNPQSQILRGRFKRNMTPEETCNEVIEMIIQAL